MRDSVVMSFCHSEIIAVNFSVDISDPNLHSINSLYLIFGLVAESCSTEFSIEHPAIKRTAKNPAKLVLLILITPIFMID